MILSVGANSVKMCKTDELKFMVVTEWSNGQVAKEAAELMYTIRTRVGWYTCGVGLHL